MRSGNLRKYCYWGLLFILVGIISWRISLHHYLLFHCLAEIFSIAIAFGVFMISWNSRKNTRDSNLVCIGIAYLFIGIVDLFHTLSYQGMNILIDSDFPANQLWIGARFMESISLLLFLPFRSNRRPRHDYLWVVLSYLLITTALLMSVFQWRCFPACFIKGQGQTAFKLYSEYVIILILITTLVLLCRNREIYAGSVYRILCVSIIFTILSELAFTFYISNYGFSNLVGHYFKILSFYLIYKAIIETGLKNPFELIFRRLNESERLLNETQHIARIGGWKMTVGSNKTVCTEEFFDVLSIPARTPFLFDDLYELLNPIDVTKLKESVQTLIAHKKRFDLEIRLECGNRQRWLRITGHKSNGGSDFETISGIIQDIDERKKSEELQRDIERIMRHDMKTPLNAVLTGPELLLDSDNLSDDEREIVTMIRDSGLSLRNMIALSQTLYQIEEGTYKVRPAPVNLTAVVLRISQELSVFTRSYNVAIKLLLDGKIMDRDYPDFIVQGEELLCYSALANLIKNAIEASPEGEAVLVDLKTTAAGKTIRISNKGAVPAAIRDSFFDKYVTCGKMDGAGIGTYSAKQMVEAHGGTIALQTSDENNETTITIELSS